MTRLDEAADVGLVDVYDHQIRRWLDDGLTEDEVLDEIAAAVAPKPLTQAGRRWYVIRIAALAAAMKRPLATWHNADRWTEQDFVERVQLDQAQGGSGGYRHVAERCVGVGPTVLLRRWQAVSGGKPWPSGRNAPLHR